MRYGWFGLWARVRASRSGGEGSSGFDPRMVVLSMVLTVVCTMPLWLLGALAVQMRADLQFSIIALGGGVAIQRIGGASLSIPLGRLSDRLGPMPAMRTAAGLAAVAALGIAAFARNFWQLAFFLAVSGASNALGQTAANLALVRVVRTGRQGIAFGVKQSALPVGALMAGLAVPLIALTVGWRWAFVVAGALALAVVIAVPWGPSERYRAPAGTVNRAYGRRPLIVMAVASFFAMGAASSLTTFIVEASSTSGLSAASAGLILTMGSAFAIGTRLGAGALADRREGRHIRGVAIMQLAGASGFLLISIGEPWSLVVGSIIAFAFGWGFNGLFWFAIVRLNQATPARATGTVMPGGMLGGVAGPLVFGWLVETWSYSMAWLTSASWALSAGLLMLFARKLLAADLRVSDAAA